MPDRAILIEKVQRSLPFVLGGVALLLAVIALWQLRDPTPSGRKVPYSAYAIQELARKFGGNGARIPNPDVVPEVKPADYAQVPQDVARRVNALIPFARGPNPPARPFILNGTPAEHERARTCLAMAAYYEAGDDALGQAAVVQVILNRMRHPAFPKSICGVVLQGSQRTTGCQFTFACDGSMARRQPTPQALIRARATAEWALTGGIFSPVGQATHYHTDFVLPYWSAEMDKITFFRGHLFFRWRGRWGQPSAFVGQYAGPEMLDARFARFLDANALTDLAASGLPLPNVDGALLSPTQIARPMVSVAGRGQVEASGSTVRSDEVRHIYYLYFGGADYPGSYAVTAWKVCAGKSPCTVYGWRTLADVPPVVSPARPDNASFLFTKDERNAQLSLWNCRQVQRDNPAQCMPGTAAPRPAAKTAP